MYKYPTRRKARPEVRSHKPAFATNPEQLLGTVNGIDAAEDEERFARALKDREFYFRINPTGIPTGMPGWLELDFLVKSFFGWRAFEIDDMEFVHRGQRKSAEMVVKDLRRKNGLAQQGVVVQEIEHVDAALLQDQDGANRLVRRLFA